MARAIVSCYATSHQDNWLIVNFKMNFGGFERKFRKKPSINHKKWIFKEQVQKWLLEEKKIPFFSFNIISHGGND